MPALPRCTLYPMAATKLPPESEYIPAFVPDPQTLFWNVLEEFYSLLPVAVSYGGNRVVASSYRTDEITELTRALGLDSSRDLRNSLWRPTTGALAGMVAKHTGLLPAMSVINLYRDGNDFINPHADPDNQFGPHVDDVVIATVSLGADRFCKLERMDGTDEAGIMLENGSLFVMRGRIQQQWLHSIPKLTTGTAGPRLSLVFVVGQQDPEDMHSWSLARVPTELKNTITSKLDRTAMHMVMSTYKGDTPRQVFLGTQEEVFLKWTEFEKAEPDSEFIVTKQTGVQVSVVVSSRNEMLSMFPNLRALLEEDDPLNTTVSEVWHPNPADVDLTKLPTVFIQEMMARAEAELAQRKA